MDKPLVRQRAFFFGMVLILAVLALLLVWQFTKAILFALAMVVILKPVYTWLFNKKGINGKASRATALTMIFFILVIAIPLGLILFGAFSQAESFFSGLNLEGIDFSVRGIITAIEKTLQGIGAGSLRFDEIQISQAVAEAIAGISDWAKGVLLNLGRSLPRIFTNVMVTLVLMYVLLPRYKSPGKQDILEIVPFPPEITQLFLDKIDLMIKAMFKGTFVIAFVQGLAMGLVFWIAGIPFVLFFTFLSMFLALVPLIGISLVVWPMGIILILTGQVWQGIFIIAAFVLIVANLDTVLRPILIPKGAQLNPALIILSVFGGLGLLGIVGAIYGPVIMILLVTSIDVYTKYILRSDLEALEKQGRIDLKELGLVSQDGEEGTNISGMFVSVLKNVTAPFRRETSTEVTPSQAADQKD